TPGSAARSTATATHLTHSHEIAKKKGPLSFGASTSPIPSAQEIVPAARARLPADKYSSISGTPQQRVVRQPAWPEQELDWGYVQTRTARPRTVPFDCYCRAIFPVSGRRTS